VALTIRRGVVLEPSLHNTHPTLLTASSSSSMSLHCNKGKVIFVSARGDSITRQERRIIAKDRFGVEEYPSPQQVWEAWGIGSLTHTDSSLDG
jgi:hypothetical protein